MPYYVTVESRGRGAYDITDELRRLVKEKELRDVLLLLSVVDPLTSLVTMEYEPNLIADLGELVDRLPGSSPHVKNAVFPKTLAVPVKNGDLALGSFQQVVLLDLSGRPGEKKVAVTVVK